MVRSTRLHAVLVMAALSLGAAACSDSSGPGDDDVVTIEMRSGNVFSPATRAVSTGTIVRWVNEDGVAHNTTSATQGLWASGNLQPDGTFQRTFESPGTFAYACTLHPGMTGTITVQ